MALRQTLRFLVATLVLPLGLGCSDTVEEDPSPWNLTNMPAPHQTLPYLYDSTAAGGSEMTAWDSLCGWTSTGERLVYGELLSIHWTDTPDEPHSSDIRCEETSLRYLALHIDVGHSVPQSEEDTLWVLLSSEAIRDWSPRPQCEDDGLSWSGGPLPTETSGHLQPGQTLGLLTHRGATDGVFSAGSRFDPLFTSSDMDALVRFQDGSAFGGSPMRASGEKERLQGLTVQELFDEADQC